MPSSRQEWSVERVIENIKSVLAPFAGAKLWHYMMWLTVLLIVLAFAGSMGEGRYWGWFLATAILSGFTAFILVMNEER